MTGREKLNQMKDKPQIIVQASTTANIGGKTYEVFPVFLVRFNPQSPQDLNGKSSCTSVTSNVEGRMPRSKHTIDFVPALNTFRIVFHGNPDDAPKIDMVPAHRVTAWTPFEAGETYLVPGSK